VFPILVILILSYTVGSAFLNVYGLAIDSILHCFVLDEQIAKKSGKEP